MELLYNGSMRKFFFHRKFSAWLKNADNILMLASTILVFLHFVCCNKRILTFHQASFIKLHEQMHVLPFFILTTLFGIIPPISLVLVFFFIVSIKDVQASFSVFLFILTILLAYFPVQKKWYGSKFKTIAFTILSTTVLGIGWSALSDFMIGKVYAVENAFFHFFNTLPITMTASTFGYIFFNCIPRKIRNHFYTGKVYDSSIECCPESLIQKKSKLSNRLSRMFIIEAIILGITAIGFSSLFLSSTPFPYDPKATIIFYTRTFIMLLNVIIPSFILINYFAQKTIAIPITLMTQAMEDFTQSTIEQGKNSVLDIHLLNIHTNDEIEHLHNILKTTTKSISLYIENIQKKQQLEQELKVAQEASKAKSNFMSSMSHEIRTPINAILGLDEMILRESAEDSIKNYAADIQSSGKTLLTIINDILDFSKIEAGKMQIIPAQYDLSSVINDLVNMVTKRAEDKGLTLNVHVDESIPNILLGDETRIKQCILNILTNAVKYTQHGSVTFDVTSTDCGSDTIKLRFRIQDTGIGIQQKDLDRLAKPFERIEESRNRNIEGTGLGMSIVTRLLSLMNSSLEVKSEYGKGSEFAFSIEQTVLDRTPIGNFTEKYRQALKTQTYHELFKAPDARILIVDDTLLNLKVAKGLLKNTDIQVDTAESGQETLQLVKQHAYDMLFIDHRMPGMDGIETLHALKKNPDASSAHTPCIVLTANAISGAKEMYLQEGFDDYLSKPIDAVEFEKLIMKYLPKEKILIPDIPQKTVKTVAMPAEKKVFPEIEGLDYDAGIKNCGSQELFLEMIQEYHDTIEKKALQLEQFLEHGDIKNYTVLVHALKSTSRLVGIQKLHELAKHLEECGDKENKEELQAKTPELLSLYRSYKELLVPLLHASSNNSEAKEPISANDYAQALDAIKEFVNAYDYDTADQIVKQVEAYAIPQEKKEEWTTLKELIAAVDQQNILALLSK